MKAFWILTIKELRLQKSNLLLLGAMFFLNVLIVLVSKTRLVDIKLSNGTVLDVLQVFYFLFGYVMFLILVPVLMGSASIAEENRMATMPMQMTLPVRRRAQYLVKMLLLFLLAAISGGVVGQLFHWYFPKGGNENFGLIDSSSFVWYSILFAASALYASSIFKQPYKAFVCAFFYIFIIILSASLVAYPDVLIIPISTQHASFGLIPGYATALIVAVLAMSGFLACLAYFNSRNERMSYGDLALQAVMIMIVSSAIALSVIYYRYNITTEAVFRKDSITGMIGNTKKFDVPRVGVIIKPEISSFYRNLGSKLGIRAKFPGALPKELNSRWGEYSIDLSSYNPHTNELFYKITRDYDSSISSGDVTESLDIETGKIKRYYSYLSRWDKDFGEPIYKEYHSIPKWMEIRSRRDSAVGNILFIKGTLVNDLAANYKYDADYITTASLADSLVQYIKKNNPKIIDVPIQIPNEIAKNIPDIKDKDLIEISQHSNSAKISDTIRTGFGYMSVDPFHNRAVILRNQLRTHNTVSKCYATLLDLETGTESYIGSFSYSGGTNYGFKTTFTPGGKFVTNIEGRTLVFDLGDATKTLPNNPQTPLAFDSDFDAAGMFCLTENKVVYYDESRFIAVVDISDFQRSNTRKQ